MIRAFAGGSDFSASRPSSDPAATTWPPPLRLAGTSPCRSIAASTSSGSPPRTADIPVGVCAHERAIARPRTAVSAIAASTDRTPASAAAVSSPTLCPVMTTSRPACGVCTTGPGIPPSSPAMNRLIATTSGCVTAVSLMASASPVVPSSSRSASAIAPAQRKNDSAPGRSSQSVSIPGFWAPCPGARTASTSSPCQARRYRGWPAPTNNNRGSLEDPSKSAGVNREPSCALGGTGHNPQAGSVPERAVALQLRESQRQLEGPGPARVRRGVAGQLGGPLEPVPDGVGVHEQCPGGGLQVAAVAEHDAHGLQDPATRGLQRHRHPLGQCGAGHGVAVQGPLGQQGL